MEGVTYVLRAVNSMQKLYMYVVQRSSICMSKRPITIILPNGQNIDCKLGGKSA